MKKYARLFSAVGVASATAVGCGYLLKDFLQTNQKPITASWTNSYEPSVRWDHNWDRRDPSSSVKTRHRSSLSSLNKKEEEKNAQGESALKTVDDSEVAKHTNKASRHLFLIRHGQYEISAKDADSMILTALGREQATETGKRLVQVGKTLKFTKLYHSNMIRAIETADLIKNELQLPELPVKMDPLLAEGAPIPPEPPIGHWKPEVYQFFADGSRIEAAFRKYFHRAPPEQLEDSYEIVVCHANVIRYFFCRSLQFPAEAWLRFNLAHGSITHITIRPDGRVSCRALGESGFQPIEKVTFS
jgi:serine/threonine-protein phosphatase PGAM5